MGSSRKNKNTDAMLKSFLEEVQTEDVEVFYLKDMKINHCIGCYHCGKHGVCIFKDDLERVYDRIDESDYIVFASPIYFNTVTSIAKTLIDRMQVYWSNKYLLGNRNYKNKFGVLLTNGGAKSEMNQFAGVDLVMDHFFKSLNCREHFGYYVSNTDAYPIWEDEDVKSELRGLGSELENIKPGTRVLERNE